MNVALRYIFFSLLYFFAVVASAKENKIEMQISITLACSGEGAVVLFAVENVADRDIMVTKNWLPWNSSRWFDMSFEIVDRGGNAHKATMRKSLWRYREESVVALRAGARMTREVPLKNIVPWVESISITRVSMRWRMSGAPFMVRLEPQVKGDSMIDVEICDENKQIESEEQKSEEAEGECNEPRG